MRTLFKVRKQGVEIKMVRKWVSDYGHSGEVEWKEEDDSYEVGNSELLAGRADVEKTPKTGEYKPTSEGLGSIEHGEETQDLRGDLKRTGWVEPSTAKRKGEIRHVCSICGTKFVGRANKKFCSPRCKKTSDMRAYRAKKKTFKPHRGAAGEIYFKVIDYESREIITFVPAAYTDTLITAIDYVKKKHADAPNLSNYVEQVKEAFETK